jgi:GT2 family glycosyltransferase
MTKIAIIVLNWQQPQLTIDTLDSLKKIKHNRFDYHIYLVDNGSKDNSCDIFTQRYQKDKDVSLIFLPDNVGFSAGNNAGIKLALKHKFEYTLLINSDVVVDPNFLTELVKTFDKDPKLGVVGPKIYFAPGFEFHKDRYKKSDIGKVIWSAGGDVDWNNVYANNIGLDEVDIGQYDTPRLDLEFITNCCVLIKSSILKKTGIMPEDYFMYCEDSDFCQKIYRHGFKIAYQPRSVIWHVNSGSSQAGGGAFHDYFLTRNRLIFASKYASFRTNFALFRESIRLLVRGTPWQKRGVIDFYLGKRQKGSWQ